MEVNHFNKGEHITDYYDHRPFNSYKDTQILVHAFIAYNLDYCSSLFHGVPRNGMLMVCSQNTAAQAIEIHWLPMNREEFCKPT